MKNGQSASRQSKANSQYTHPDERKRCAQISVMSQAKAFREQLQSYACHNARSDGEHASIDNITWSCVASPGDLEPQSGDAGSEWLADASEKGAPEHGFPAAVDGEVEWERHGEAFGDVVDE